MRFIIGDDFIDYELCRDVKGAHKAGVFQDFGAWEKIECPGRERDIHRC